MSERKFSVGDRVRVIGADRDPSDVGRVTTIVGSGLGTNVHGSKELGYFVNLPCGPIARTYNGLAIYRSHHLEPYYDGDEPAKWSDCVWQPKQVSA